MAEKQPRYQHWPVTDIDVLDEPERRMIYADPLLRLHDGVVVDLNAACALSEPLAPGTK